MNKPAKAMIGLLVMVCTTHLTLATTPKNLQLSTTVNELSGHFLASRLKHDELDKETKIGLIKQDTRIELDETDIRTAAVSLIGGTIQAMSVVRLPPRRKIIVDRPFVFAIVDNRSQTILFNGVLVRPES